MQQTGHHTPLQGHLPWGALMSGKGGGSPAACSR